MQFLYEYSSQTKDAFVLVHQGKEFTKIIMLNKDLVRGESDFSVFAKNKWLKEHHHTIITSYVLNKEGLPIGVYGDNVEFESCLLVKSVLNKLIDGTDNISVNLAALNTSVTFHLLQTFQLTGITKINVYKDELVYKSLAARTQSEFSTVARMSKLATVEDMKARYDCSWVFEVTGTHIEEYYEWEKDEKTKKQVKVKKQKLVKEYGKMIKDYKSITTMEELMWLKSELQKLPDDYFVGYDVETTGLKFFYMPDKKEEKDRILGFSMAWKDNQGVYIPLESKVFECLNVHQVYDVLYEELLRLHIIAHNGQYEWKVNYDMGKTITVDEDTLLLDFNIFPFIIPGFKTLKNLTRLWFGHETWEFDQLFSGKADPEMLVYLPLDLITIYGCADSDYARMLYFKEIEYLNDSQKTSYDVDRRLIEILAKSEYYGVAVDKKRTFEQKEILEADKLTVEAIMHNYIREQGLENYQNRRLGELMIQVQKKFPNSTMEKLTEFANNVLEEDHNWSQANEDKFNEILGELMEKKPYTSQDTLSKIMFNLLEYPILLYTTPNKKQRAEQEKRKQKALAEGKDWKPDPPKPATNEEAMKLLGSYKLEDASSILKEDVISADGKTILLEASKVNKLRYPLVAMLLEHKRIDKLLSTFYKTQTKDESIYLYNENNATAAATARLISTVQTIAGNTKKNIVPYPKSYGVNADYSQIEVRNMAGCANAYWHSIQDKINKEELSVYHREGLEPYIRQLNNPETDIHRLTASSMFGIKPEDINGDQRHNAKKFTFGVPYGMGAFSLSADDLINYVDNLSADAQERTEDIVIDGGVGLMKWNFGNYPIYKYLNAKRKQARTPISGEGFVKLWVENEGPMKDDLPDFDTFIDILKNLQPGGILYGKKLSEYQMAHLEQCFTLFKAKQQAGKLPPYFDGRTVGYVDSTYGRRRYFFLEDLDGSALASIDKAAGNYPIQSGARDLFFMNKLNLYEAMRQHGLINNPTNWEEPKPDKFTMEAFVHDEFYGSADLNVHPYLLVKLIFDNCFVNIPYHPTYFMGVNFVNTWYAGKAGTNELPVALVKDIATMPEEEWPEFKDGFFIFGDRKIWVVDYFSLLIHNWEIKRVVWEILSQGAAHGKNIKLDTNPNDIDWDEVASWITNYSVKPRIITAAVLLGATKSDKFADMLERIWRNKDYDFRVHDFKSSQIPPYVFSSYEDPLAEPAEEVEEAEEAEDTDTFDMFLSADTDDTEQFEMFANFEDEEVSQVAEQVASKIDQRIIQEQKICDQYMVAQNEAYFGKTSKARDVRQHKNMKISVESDGRIMLMITGVLRLNLSKVYPKYRPMILRDIRDKFGDPNGSKIEVFTSAGKQDANFRGFNFERRELESILKKYDEMSVAEGHSK